MYAPPQRDKSVKFTGGRGDDDGDDEEGGGTRPPKLQRPRRGSRKASNGSMLASMRGFYRSQRKIMLRHGVSEKETAEFIQKQQEDEEKRRFLSVMLGATTYEKSDVLSEAALILPEQAKLKLARILAALGIRLGMRLGGMCGEQQEELLAGDPQLRHDWLVMVHAQEQEQQAEDEATMRRLLLTGGATSPSPVGADGPGPGFVPGAGGRPQAGYHPTGIFDVNGSADTERKLRGGDSTGYGKGGFVGMQMHGQGTSGGPSQGAPASMHAARGPTELAGEGAFGAGSDPLDSGNGKEAAGSSLLDEWKHGQLGRRPQGGGGTGQSGGNGGQSRATGESKREAVQLLGSKRAIRLGKSNRQLLLQGMDGSTSDSGMEAGSSKQSDDGRRTPVGSAAQT